MFQRTDVTKQAYFAKEIEKHQPTIERQTAENLKIIHRSFSTPAEKERF